ncbi:PucR family transcriptional regulator ligand-binding domain-containing protein, partial [Nonomuraea sp. NPDC004297]
MNLRPLAGTTGPGVLDAPVRWVAVSELADPTPYLEGGELLLTTGMRMAGDLTGYVARLVHRGVAGLGFGVGVSHEEVPPALVEAAEAAGLPLLEVPRETPFIAIGKAVSELLAAEQYEEISRAFAAQGRLTRAALRPEGMHAVIDRLAREVSGWAALLDESGEVRHATRGADTVAVTSELARLRGAGPGSGPGSGAQVGERVGRLPASLALSGPGRHIVLQPLGGGPRPKGFFAVGAPQAFSPVAHTVINAAGSLLTLAMEQGRAQLAAERRVRTSVLELLLAGEWDRARTVLGALGGRLPEAPLVVLAADADALETLETHGFAATLGGDSDGDLSEYGSGGSGSGGGAYGGGVGGSGGASGGGSGGGAVGGGAHGGGAVGGGVNGGGGSGSAAGGGVDGGGAGGGSGRDRSREGGGGPAVGGEQARGVPGEGVVVALVAEGVAEGVAWEAAVSAEASVGVSQPCGPGAAELRNAIDQAGRALEAARSRRGARPDAGGPGEGPPPGRGTTPAQAAGQGRVPDQGAASGKEPV